MQRPEQHLIDRVEETERAYREAQRALSDRIVELSPYKKGAAQFHDTPERVWGDCPAPVKELLAGALDYSEQETLRRLGVDIELTPEELEYLNGADRVELFLWAVEEVERGNRAAQTFVDGRLRGFEKRPPPWPMMDLVEEVAANGLGRLPGDITLEWGGRS